MRTLSICVLTLVYFFSNAQHNFKLTGKIEILSASKKIILSSPGGNFHADINPDGTFVIAGKLSESGTGLIKTDSSASDAIWLEPGNYNIKCKEITKESIRGYLFRIPQLKGPQDAEVYYGYSQPQYYINGTREEMRKIRKDFAIKYLDSLLTNIPSSKVIPEILRFSKPFIGDEATLMYMSLLNQDQIKRDDFKMLEDYFKRKEKIEKEIYFQDFEMTDQNGKALKLSSVKKRLILLDFWSSDCAPCRRKHPKLAELYKKYASKGFEIISVSFDDTRDDWLKAIIKDKMSWINVSELKGWKTSLSESYFIKSLPFAIWLDKDKKIISLDNLTEKEIEEYLK